MLVSVTYVVSSESYGCTHVKESWSCFDIAVIMVLPATTPSMVYVVMATKGLSLLSVSVERWVAIIPRTVMDLT